MEKKDKLSDVIFLDRTKEVFIADLFIDYGEGNSCRYHSTEVMYCPHCNKMSKLYDAVFFLDDKIKESCIKDDFQPYYSDYNQVKKIDDKIVLTCPICGEDLTNHEIRKLRTGNGWYNDNFQIIGYNFSKSEDKLVFTIFENVFFPRTDIEKLAMMKINFRIVFNLKTGQTYVLEPRDKKTGKKPSFIKTPRIKNCTYEGRSFINYIMSMALRNEEILNAMAKELCNVHGLNYETEFDFNDTELNSLVEKSWSCNKNSKNKLSFEFLTFFNRFHKYGCKNSLRMRIYFEEMGRWNFNKKAMKKLKEFFRVLYKVDDGEELYQLIAKKSKIPDKKRLKRFLFSNPMEILKCSLICNMGFQDINVIISILEGNKIFLNYHIDSWLSGQHNEVLSFSNELVTRKGETIAKKLLFDDFKENEYNMFLDTCRMYEIFKKYNFLNKNSFKGTVREMHDKFALDYRKIQEKNLEISYSKENIKLQKEIDGFKFILAKNTHQLIDVGQEMGICVGSYGWNAANNKLIIVLMMQEKKYVGCIELSCDGKHLRQAKAKFNNKLQEKKAEALKKWVEMMNIDGENCWDYEHILNNKIEYEESKIYQGHTNYAGYGRHYDHQVDPFEHEYGEIPFD